ncbi:MAG: DUF3828 domain-containing protein [Candidatus Zambryskibacteria bacterium]|nr:DUF3828 domain-containing protein [Candidatus Zambryskibacteria bacterium]
METSNGMKKTVIIGIIIVLAVVFILFIKGSNEQQVSKLDATDTVKNFYDGWLMAAQQLTTEPNRATLAKSPILSKELRNQLVDALKQPNTTLDPVLCQTVIPENISTRTVSNTADEAEILVTSKDKTVTEQAIVTLVKYNDGWYIDNIQCSLGEFAPEREFSFEREGYLLKDSIPSPYDSKDWHLIFEENNTPGHVVPLFFNSESQCTSLDESKSVCKPDQFTEATKVFIYGQMSERGVNVEQLEIIE